MITPMSYLVRITCLDIGMIGEMSTLHSFQFEIKFDDPGLRKRGAATNIYNKTPKYTHRLVTLEPIGIRLATVHPIGTS